MAVVQGKQVAKELSNLTDLLGDRSQLLNHEHLEVFLNGDLLSGENPAG